MYRPVLRFRDGLPPRTFLRADVKKLQRSLNQHGFRAVVDGQFGYGTEFAVKQFQKANGLTVDGIVGPATWQALTAVPRPPTPDPTPTPVPSPSPEPPRLRAMRSRRTTENTTLSSSAIEELLKAIVCTLMLLPNASVFSQV